METVKRVWHRWRLGHWHRVEVRAQLRADRARRWLAWHEVALQGAAEPVSLTPVVDALVDIDDYRLRRAELDAPFDMDGPDSPEADHLFWETSAEDLMGDGHEG